MTQKTYLDSGIERLKDMAPVDRRPWQLMMTGVSAEPMNIEISPGTSRALTRIFDLWPDLGVVTIGTENGDVRVTRDFPSDTQARIDDLIAGIFENDPTITAIALPGHTATPDNPYSSPHGRVGAAITAAVVSGEITPDDAIGRLKALFPTVRKDGAHDE
ncbi:hypothetical protein [Bradyrhizobium sp. USDA 4520]